MSVFVYWAARLGILAAVWAVLWFALRWQDLVSLIAAFVVAWLVSYLALPGLRRAAAEQMDRWVGRTERGIKQADAEEDAEIEGGR